jgi:mono/diheme cytochrome c family protein
MKNARITIVFACFCAASALFALPSSRATDTNSPAKDITFTKDVAPIFFEKCAECHRPGEAAPFSTLSYKEARPWARSIREQVISREMPPWRADPHVGRFKNDRRLTDAEIETIAAWVDGGAKEGDPKHLPAAPEFADGWAIGKPDLVIPMPEEFALNASGPDEYQYFEVDTGFTEDKYVQMAEARPGNRRIVHHILAFVQPPPKDGESPKKIAKEEIERMERESIFYRDGFLLRARPDAPVYDDGCGLPNGGQGSARDGGRQESRLRGLGMLLTGFAPGMNPWIWEPGTVKKIPAGSKITFQVHYSKVAGSPQKDRSMIGLVFAKQPPQRQLITRPIQNNYFKIPPGAENHRVTACWTTTEDIRLTAALPHMHVRGKAIDIKAFYPDGRSETLLNVPNYSFAWQTVYYFKQPLAIPKGTRLVVTGYFNNSSKNKYNPNPAQAVRFGEPTYDEMMASFIDYTIEGQPLKPVISINVPSSAKSN